MRLINIIFVGFMCTSCTLSFENTAIHGNSHDIGETEQTTTAEPELEVEAEDPYSIWSWI